MPQLRLSAIDNRRLFSNYYLENRVPKSQAWRDFDKAREALDRIKDIYKKKKHWLTQGSERQLRKELIEPILDVINPYYLVDETIPGGLKPDFIFFNTREAKREKRLPDAIAVGDAKAYGTGFDAPLERQVRSPVRQVYDYFIQSETRWGVLTDGARWRLMLKDVRQEYYFEVDLVDILERYDYDSFRFFYFFFRREAFTIDSKGRCYLDRVIEGSDRYAQEIGEELKERVYKALLALARGFCSWEANALDASDSDVRERVRKNCLILLYRLLFTFYAEDWGFLPAEDARYQEIGLRSRLRHIKHAMKRGTSSIPSELHSYWGSLQNLFELIDNGNEKLGIPPYNGGLFHRTSDGAILGGDDFLDRYDIGNRYIAEAIHLLGTATDPETGEEAEVDYSSLESRHLGSIYEGLLEFKLAYAEEPQAIVKRKGKEVWIPLKEYAGKTPADDLPDDRRVERAELYMETEKHERKVTGSYYTPDFVVKYIVENTVGPVVEEKWDSALKEGLPLKDATLATRVLDPAMGSGHFLVGCVEFLSERLLKAIEQDVEANRLSEEETKHCTLEWAKREVLSHCIYGVDLNELAVELAKVSLWLTTISKDKPLSFLDHRLKCGNSLIGTNLADLKAYPQASPRGARKKENASLPGFVSDIFIDKLIGKIRELEAIRDDQIEDVKRKERVFDEFRKLPEYEKTKAIADVYTSVRFGNEVTPTERKSPKEVYFHLIYSLDYPENWQPKTKTGWFKRAKEIAEEKKFFHWELEFPEVFFEDGKVRPDHGFDAVVGNPPYVRIYRGQIPEEDTAYYKQVFRSAHMKFDLYVLFVEFGLDILAFNGRFSMIIPDKWMSSPYGEPLRHRILESRFEKLLDLRGLRIFEDVAVDNVIPVIARATPRDDDKVEILRGRSDSPGSIALETLTEVRQGIFGGLSQAQIRLEISDRSASLLRKIQEQSVELGRICYVNWGLRTGTAAKTREMISDQKRSSRYRRLIRGEDIDDRYSLVEAKRFIDYDVSRLYNPMFSEFFENPKLVFRKISGSRGLLAVLDKSGSYGFSTVIIATRHSHLEGVERPGVIPPTPESRQYDSLGYLLALVNSKLMRWYYEMLLSDRLSVVPNQVKELPIRRVSFATPEDRRLQLVRQAKEIYDGCLGTSDSQGLDAFVEERLASDSKEADVAYDLLSILAEGMTDMNQKKNGEKKRFLEWLEGYLKLEIAEMTLRTKIQEFCRFDWQVLRDAVVSNKQRITEFDITRSKPLQTVKDEYDESMQDLGPLLEAIQFTDELIDRIVYRLYGLTDEETRIVEGSFEER